MTFAIVGANLAGGRAAETLRRRGFDGRVVLIGADEQPPYERPPLSKQLLLGTMAPQDTLLRSEGGWVDLDVELVLGRMVTALRPSERRLEFDDGASLPADKVLLCTGSRPRRLAVDGGGLSGVVHLRTLDDALLIAERLCGGAAVVVVGGGFIGAEVAASAVSRGCQVTMLEAEALPLSRLLGPEIGRFFADAHRQRGVDVRTGTTVNCIEGDNEVRRVRLSDGTTVDADLVVVGVGVLPAVELAEAAGAAVANGIVVDEYCRTSIEGVYAAGDVTDHPNKIFGARFRLESWKNAQDQAVSAAGSMIGDQLPYNQVPWFWSDQYDLNLQICGIPSFGDSFRLRGDLGSRAFSLFYLREARLVGVVGVNRAQDVRRASSLIESHATVDPDQLVDESVDLRKLGAQGSR
jgi:3-phenylpropionate/trans-cinnamate dioxygenase ferredoxin reductase subunit